MTYSIAYTLGLDAANRQMHSAGRTAWNEDDAHLAAATLDRYFPLCAELPGIDPVLCGCPTCNGLIRVESHGPAETLPR